MASKRGLHVISGDILSIEKNKIYNINCYTENIQNAGNNS